jgi:hypothetical protein
LEPGKDQFVNMVLQREVGLAFEWIASGPLRGCRGRKFARQKASRQRENDKEN